MATVAHHVYSSYDPEDRERLEAETGQLDADSDAPEPPEPADPWLTEKAYGLSKRVANPPVFVAATFGYDQWDYGTNLTSSSSLSSRSQEENVSEWYRSLARRRTGSAPASQSPQQDSIASKRTSERRNKNNWFISRVLEASESSQPGSSRSTTPGTSASPGPTLADILARDPPPLPTQAPYTPPVWLSIGPSNKGFAMLQKSGWEEGEALGRATRSRSGLGCSGKGKDAASWGRTDPPNEVKKEVIDLSCLDEDVIDLTSVDEEVGESDSVFAVQDDVKRSVSSPPSILQQGGLTDDLDHNPRALLTPLPTVLKNDRLGLGLKAKTTGNGLYRAPVKRVTHGQAALAAHIRANEELWLMKKAAGRGRRGFERLKKREEEGRRNMLAYMNAD
ncbi:hypothetical protein M0805_001473 [Coniferiporia weirii]|nr:hypothetical protein M0805_001473 [Coniferiporia weirii]